MENNCYKAWPKPRHKLLLLFSICLSLWFALFVLVYHNGSCTGKPKTRSDYLHDVFRFFTTTGPGRPTGKPIGLGLHGYSHRPTGRASSSGFLEESNNGSSAVHKERVHNAPMKQVCYYWIPRKDSPGGNLTVGEIDPFICTHIVISCAVIKNNTIITLNQEDVKIYSEVMNLKKQNPNLRVLLSLVDGFPSLVRNEKAVTIFAFNAQQFIIKYGFDGLDLDWEFPAWPVWKRDEHERKWFTYLLLQLNNALKLASHPPLLLTVAVGAPQTIVDSSYEVSELAKYVDYVAIMTYDFHMFQSYMPFTGHNAPLSRGLGEKGFLGKLNVAWATKYWLEKGMPKEQLVVGVPTYGHTWKLLSEDWYNVGAPAVKAGMFNNYISYLETCIFIKEGARRYFDDSCQVPYAVRERDWISYDDSQSIRAKAEWIKSMGVAGIMTWNLNCDDWTGLCSGKKFELHNIIKNVIRE